MLTSSITYGYQHAGEFPGTRYPAGAGQRTAGRSPSEPSHAAEPWIPPFREEENSPEKLGGFLTLSIVINII